MSDLAVLKIVSAGQPSSQEFCHLEWDVEREQWRAWGDDGPEAFTHDRALAALRVFALQRHSQIHVSNLREVGARQRFNYPMLVAFAVAVVGIFFFVIGVVQVIHSGL